MSEEQNYDLTIVGGGLDPSAHLSWEACKTIREAKTICYHGAACAVSVEQWLSNLAKEASFIDLDAPNYQVGQQRPEMYRDTAAKIVELARNGGVVSLEPGSALVTDLVTQYALKLAEQAHLTARVLPGVSTLECMLVEFGLDPSSGLQIVLAQELVAKQIQLNPQCDSIIIQPGYYDSLWWMGLVKSRENRYEELMRTLARAFPSDAKMAMVRFPMLPGDATHKFWFQLEELPEVAPILTQLHTLFIPRVGAETRDPSFMQRIRSWEKSVRFVETDANGHPVQENSHPSNRTLVELEKGLPPKLLEQSARWKREWRKDQVQRNLSRVE